MRPDQERVRNLLTDTVTLLCKNGLQYQTELRVQGVLGITLDNNDVFIVHINEKFGGDISGAISIRNDEGDAAKTLLGSRKSHEINRSDAPGSINSKTVHKRRWQSRESSASPSLPANGSQPHIVQRPIKRLVPSKTETSPCDVGNRSAFLHLTGNDSIIESSEVFDVKVKTELDDVIILEDNQDNGSETSLIISHMTDQTAMLDSYPDLASNEIQGSYGSFGEVLGATDISTDGAVPPAKRRATTGSIHDSYSGSSEMGPTSDGLFVTGIIRNETVSGDVAPQTTTATSWDQSQIPDFGSLSPRDSQMILDSIPGCSTWDTSQQSTTRTPTSHLSLQNTSDQSSESVCSSGGPSCRFPSGQLPTKVLRNPPVSKRFKSDSHQCLHCGAAFNDVTQLDCHVRSKHAGMRFACPHCQRTFAWKGGLSEHVRFTHQKLSRYRCETCGKRYARRSSYYDHLATHTGVKRNVCPVCMKGFTFRHNMKTHISRVHADEIAPM